MGKVSIIHLGKEALTPDGFYINADGRWYENGKAVYVSGKGISTKKQETAQLGNKTKTSYSSGGSGGSGGGGRGGNSSGSFEAANYRYAVRHMDEQECLVLSGGKFFKRCMDNH